MFIDIDCEIGWLISDWQGLNLYVKDVDCDIYIYIDWYELLWLLSWDESVMAIYVEWDEISTIVGSVDWCICWRCDIDVTIESVIAIYDEWCELRWLLKVWLAYMMKDVTIEKCWMIHEWWWMSSGQYESTWYIRMKWTRMNRKQRNETELWLCYRIECALHLTNLKELSTVYFSHCKFIGNIDRRTMNGSVLPSS